MTIRARIIPGWPWDNLVSHPITGYESDPERGE